MEKAMLWKPELEAMPRERLLEYQLDLFRKQLAQSLDGKRLALWSGKTYSTG